MVEILLHEPEPMSERLERLHLFPGRHLGEDEFDRLQDYTDARLDRLLGDWQPGILRGLDVKLGVLGVDAEGFVVTPGLAVAGNGRVIGLYLPIRQTWQTLIEDYLAEPGVTDAAGVFYLTLRRSSREIDADQDVDACQRTELDPSRDTRLVTLGALGLRRLSLAGEAPEAMAREQIENWIAADRVDGQFLRGMSNAVPLGLMAIVPSGDGYRVAWFSREAGRYLAVHNGAYLVLLDQVSAAFERILAAFGGDTRPLPQYLDEELHLDFLPAAGQLPRELLQDPASATPGLLWLPEHLYVDMVPVPEEGVHELLERHVARRVIDLRQPAGDRLRLLLAINEPDYRRDLLDFPQTDWKLQDDLHRYFIRAHAAWLSWHRQFDHLYNLREDVNLDEEEVESLKLPEPLAPPPRPEPVFADLIDRAASELREPGETQPPYPYSGGIPAAPDFYTDWLVADPAAPDGPPIPPPPEEPEQDGLVIRYALNEVAIEQLDNQIRAARTRLEKHRDYLLLQRQQLDSQTVSMAALGGGVAGDGSGLQVARWLPFTQLKATPFTAPADASEPSASAGIPASQAERTATASYLKIAGGANLALRAASDTIGVLTPKKTKEDQFVLSQTALRYALAKKPAQSSAAEYGLDASRLNRLSQAAKQAISKPAFDTKEYRFGVLEHIRPEIKEYKMAYRGMAELISTVDGLFDPTEAAAIRAALRRFGTPRSPDELDVLDEENRTGHADTDRLNSIQARYEELFKASQILTRQIAYMEGRYNRIEAQLERRLRTRVKREGDRDRLAGLIKLAREELETLDKRRIEYLGDYNVAQSLLDDDWRRVHDSNEERTRILTHELRGLYYVRVRPTPVTAALADPLELRFGTADDIVPGCDWVEDPEVPEEIVEFFDAVLEIPIEDWASLRPLKPRLPPVSRVNYMYALRKTRFDKRRAHRQAISGRTVLRTRLHNLVLQNQSVLQQLSLPALPAAAGSVRAFQQASARVLSLEDVLTGTNGRLRRGGQRLRDRLEQALTCLLDKLNELPPSIRLQWGQLAEDDRIDVERVERWPSLQRAEREDFNAIRTLAELVDWWFRQLDKGSSGTGRSAMRNMIRACLIHASLGDPAEILHGRVQVPPRRLAVGEGLRLKLNRAALPGTALQLLDRQQKLVATLNVDDQDESGTIANVVRVTRADVSVTTGFTVVASRLTNRLAQPR